MPRFKLTLEYNGTRYSGWQMQANSRTIQGELGRAVREVTGRERFEIYGSGRTDAGVHAIAQVAHLDVATGLPPASLLTRLNESLPADINVLRVDTASHKFHARHDATARAYVYQIARRRTAFAKPYVWWIRDPLDLARMRAAAGLLTGLHDFASFTDDDEDEKSTKVKVSRVDVEEDGALVLVRIVGSHFLWKMVRRMVGVLAAVGRHDLEVEAVAKLLVERSRLPARLTAPAAGLFLEWVSYDRATPGASSLPVSLR